jgi:hypothetical protein
MTKITIERLGGLAGFGGPMSRLESKGEAAMESLPDEDRAAVDALFASPISASPPMPDGFRYRITLHAPGGEETIEVPETDVPMSLQTAIQDRLR